MIKICDWYRDDICDCFCDGLNIHCKNYSGYFCIDDVVRRLNDGLKRTQEELDMCKKWLLEYQVANQLTLNELDDLCFEDSVWVFEQIFG